MALIETLIGPITSLLDKIIPDKEARAKAQYELLKLEASDFTLAPFEDPVLQIGSLKASLPQLKGLSGALSGFEIAADGTPRADGISFCCRQQR